MKHLLDIEQWMNRETAFILLIVLFVGVVIGARVMYGLAKTMFFNQQPPFLGGYQQPYSPGMPPQQHPKDGSLLGILLILFLLGVILLLLGQSLLSSNKGSSNGEHLQGQPLSGQIPKNIETVPKGMPRASKPAMETVPDFVGKVDEAELAPKHFETVGAYGEARTYLIRIKIYPSEKAAQKAGDELLNLGVPAGYYPTKLLGAPAYATFIGLYRSEDIAKFVRHELKLKNAVVLLAKGLDLQWR